MCVVAHVARRAVRVHVRGMPRWSALALVATTVCVGCAADDGDVTPVPVDDASTIDSSSGDALATDSGSADTSLADSGNVDTDLEDSDESIDSSAGDAAAVDTSAPDTSDTASPDTASPDTADTALPDTESPDTASADSAAADTELPDTAPVDTGPPTWGTICGVAGAPKLVGQIFAPNGNDPVPFSFAYVPISIKPMPSTVTCETCIDAIDPPYAAMKTGVDGRFSVDLTDVPTSAPLRLVVRKGRFRKVTTFTAACGATVTVAKTATTLPGATSTGSDLPKIAVGSGNADHLDDVVLAMGIREFDCFEGRTTSTANCPTTQRTGKRILELLKDPPALASYSLLFISCAPNIWSSYSTADRATIVKNLGAWVSSGGRMIVTDHSYDYVAQTWPNEIIWHGPPRVGGVWPIGTLSGAGANVGIAPTTGTTFPGVIDDPILTAWLKLPEIGVASAPNVALSGWLAPWTVQQSLPTTTTQVVHGNVQYDYPKGGATESTDLPLTSKFTVSGCGRVIYSSYHTSTGSSTTLAPQERILEYLMLESAACIGTD